MLINPFARARRGGNAPFRLGLPSRSGVPARRLAVAALTLCGLTVAGCSPAFYREQADAQVYQILRDRKYDTVGYNPQVRVGSSAIRNDAPGAASATEARDNAQSLKG